ncbi:MAG: DUF5678 domain-containing protein [Patescibacteria group bacterium]
MVTNIDFTKILTPNYAGMWVAMDENETHVIAAARTPNEAIEEAKKQGIKNPVVTFVVEDYGNLIPAIL